MEFLLNLDKSLLYFFSTTLSNPFLDKLMPFITNLNNHGELWIGMSIVLMINKDIRVKRLGLSMLIAVAFGYLVGEAALKNIIGRERPIGDEFSHNFIVKIPTSFSFPSGHTTSSFAAFGVYLFSKAKYRYWILVLAVLMAFSRMYLHVHYPSDILGGIILGIICGKVGVYIGNALLVRVRREI
jgi:undecaprenyl-diphosphatase